MRYNSSFFQFSTSQNVKYIKYVDVASEELGTVYPIVRAAYEGEKVYIICYSQTPPQWTKEGEDIRSHKSLDDHILVIENVVGKDTGNYVCEGTLESGQNFTASSELLVGGKF